MQYYSLTCDNEYMCQEKRALILGYFYYNQLVVKQAHRKTYLRIYIVNYG